jgi:hypothetical protein
MCIRKDNLTSEFLTAEVAVVMLPEIWTVLMSRHGACNPSEACVIDAALRSTKSVTREEIDANYARNLTEKIAVKKAEILKNQPGVFGTDLTETDIDRMMDEGGPVSDKDLSFHEPLNSELRDKLFERYAPVPAPGEVHVHNFDRLHGFCRCGHLESTANEL